MKKTCRVQTLAADGLCSVDYCLDCSVFHLKIGYATLHIDPKSYVTLCNTANTALARFQRQRKTADALRLAELREIENPLH